MFRGGRLTVSLRTLRRGSGAGSPCPIPDAACESPACYSIGLKGSRRSLSELRRRRFPIVAMAGLLVTIIKQSAHVGRVERLRQLHREIGPNVGEFVVDAVLAARL